MLKQTATLASSRSIRFFFGLLVLLIAFGSIARFQKAAIDQLAAPHDIGFETSNMATIKSIQAGESIYSEHFYSDKPFIITLYSPLYFYLVAALPQNPSNIFFTGRVVSLVSILLTALLLFLPGDMKKNQLYGVLALSWFLMIHVVIQYGAYLRCDTMALFFAALSVVCLEKVRTSKKIIALCVFFGFLAFLCKQSYVAAIITCFIYLCLNNRKNAVWFCIVSVMLFGGFAIFAQIVWGYGYWFSTVISLSQHPIGLDFFLKQWGVMLKQPLFVFLLFITLSSIIYAVIKFKFLALKKSPYFLYVIFTLMVLLTTLGKIGSDTNYFLEFILACLLWNVFFIRSFFSHQAATLAKSFLLVLFIGLAALELINVEQSTYAYADKNSNAFLGNMYAVARAEIDELGPLKNNRFLILDAHRPIYAISQEAYLNDPFCYWTMWKYKILDVNPMHLAIEDKYFSIIMLFSHPKKGSSTPCFKRMIINLNENYEFRKKGVFFYFTPREQLSNL